MPRFEHLLIDQTRQRRESVPGAPAARRARIAMMAAFREARADLLEWATRLMGELYRAAGFDELAKDVEYVPATQPNEYRPLRGQIRTIERFLGRNIPWAALDTQVAMTVFRKLRQTLLCLQLLPPRQVLHPR